MESKLMSMSVANVYLKATWDKTSRSVYFLSLGVNCTNSYEFIMVVHSSNRKEIMHPGIVVVPLQLQSIIFLVFNMNLEAKRR